MPADEEALFPIVGLGASAGGLEALEQFLAQVPPDCGMAFVVIQHLDPTHPTLLSELLQRATVMPVAQASDGRAVRPGNVYVIPPNKDLSILNGELHLLNPPEQHGLRLPIDSFFRALAEDRRERAAAVVLSGMGSDGSLGLRAVKARAGLTLAQEPSDAKFDSMPQAAIATGLVDIVATAEAMPALIVQYFSRALPPAYGEPLLNASDQSSLDKIVILLRDRAGNDFSLYKKNTLCRRIERRMALHQIDQFGLYLRYLRENPQELDLLFKELLIGVTSFFRDPAVWAYLIAEALPALFAAEPDGKALRAWVTACSSGEEAYSLAMAFQEALELAQPPGRFSLQVFATDLDADAIALARLGVYPATIAADVGAERLRRFFIRDGKGYRIAPEIRAQVVFAPQNVLMDPPFTKLDILTCRNLLIYLGLPLQKRLLPLFHYALNPHGLLLLGSAEGIGVGAHWFTPLDNMLRIYRRSESPLLMADLEFPSRHPTPKPTITEHAMPTPAVPDNLQALTDSVLLQTYAPPAVLVNADGDILYISGRTGKYLEPAAGKANWNIQAMAREGLRPALADALRLALAQQPTAVCLNGLTVGSNGGAQTVNLVVQALAQPAALRGRLLVVFYDIAKPRKSSRKASANAADAALAAELQQAHTAMEALREAMQISQEELKSANEELQSANEELQSTNEELTTSKEEMQSMNEELQTVNAELQAKVADLSWLSNDMYNLVNSLEIATVFLDNGLRIRRFTPRASQIFKLIAADVGRPLSDIATDLDYPRLHEDAAAVLDSLLFREQQIRTHDQRWFNVRILPYRTQDNVIDGVVITFIDISTTKALEAELRRPPAPPATDVTP